MKTSLIAAAILIAATAADAANFRCAGDFIRPGYDSFTVLRKCGDPIYKEVIGYKLAGNRDREAKVEKWIYGPDNGWYYHLKFEGGELKEIEEIRE